MAGSFTVEAALVLIIIVSVLGGLLLLALKTGQAVRLEAQAVAAEAREEEDLGPVDLIRLTGFLEVWIPEESS